MSDYGILQPDHSIKVVPFEEYFEHLKAHGHISRVAETLISKDDYTIRVSTIFLHTDHGHGGPPMWFETMSFADAGIDDWGYRQDRYSTWDEAMAGHNYEVEWCTLHIDGLIAQRKAALAKAPRPVPDQLKAAPRSLDLGDENNR